MSYPTMAVQTDTLMRPHSSLASRSSRLVSRLSWGSRAKEETTLGEQQPSIPRYMTDTKASHAAKAPIATDASLPNSISTPSPQAQPNGTHITSVPATIAPSAAQRAPINEDPPSTLANLVSFYQIGRVQPPNTMSPAATKPTSTSKKPGVLTPRVPSDTSQKPLPSAPIAYVTPTVPHTTRTLVDAQDRPLKRSPGTPEEIEWRPLSPARYTPGSTHRQSLLPVPSSKSTTPESKNGVKVTTPKAGYKASPHRGLDKASGLSVKTHLPVPSEKRASLTAPIRLEKARSANELDLSPGIAAVVEYAGTPGSPTSGLTRSASLRDQIFHLRHRMREEDSDETNDSDDTDSSSITDFIHKREHTLQVRPRKRNVKLPNGTSLRKENRNFRQNSTIQTFPGVSEELKDLDVNSAKQETPESTPSSSKYTPSKLGPSSAHNHPTNDPKMKLSIEKFDQSDKENQGPPSDATDTRPHPGKSSIRHICEDKSNPLPSSDGRPSTSSIGTVLKNGLTESMQYGIGSNTDYSADDSDAAPVEATYGATPTPLPKFLADDASIKPFSKASLESRNHRLRRIGSRSSEGGFGMTLRISDDADELILGAKETTDGAPAEPDLSRKYRSQPEGRRSAIFESISAPFKGKDDAVKNSRQHSRRNSTQSTHGHTAGADSIRSSKVLEDIAASPTVPARSSARLAEAGKAAGKAAEHPRPVQSVKAMKNSTELETFRARRDVSPHANVMLGFNAAGPTLTSKAIDTSASRPIVTPTSVYSTKANDAKSWMPTRAPPPVPPQNKATVKRASDPRLASKHDAQKNKKSTTSSPANASTSAEALNPKAKDDVASSSSLAVTKPVRVKTKFSKIFKRGSKGKEKVETPEVEATQDDALGVDGAVQNGIRSAQALMERAHGMRAPDPHKRQYIDAANAILNAIATLKQSEVSAQKAETFAKEAEIAAEKAMQASRESSMFRDMMTEHLRMVAKNIK